MVANMFLQPLDHTFLYNFPLWFRKSADHRHAVLTVRRNETTFTLPKMTVGGIRAHKDYLGWRLRWFYVARGLYETSNVSAILDL